MPRIFGLLVLLGSLVLTIPGHATEVTYLFEGLVSAYYPNTGSQFAQYDDFRGLVTFNTTVPDSNPDPQIGTYLNAVTALSFSLGSYTGALRPGFGPDNSSVVVNNGTGMGGIDSFGFTALITGPNIGAASPSSMSLTLFDTLFNMLTSTDIPSDINPAVLRFGSRNFVVEFAGSPDAPIIQGTLYGFSPTPVPLPTSLVLFASGMAGLCGLILKWKECLG